MRLSNERGVSLIELTIATAIITIALFLITANSMSSVGTLRGMARVAANAERIGNVVHSIEKHVRGATAFRPSAWLTEDLGTSATSLIEIDTLRGFPDVGTLVLATGTPAREVIEYGRARDTETVRGFDQLLRGQRGTMPLAHATGTAVRWAPHGEVLIGTPAPGTFDGQSASIGGPVYFRGEATGVVFQRPLAIGATRQLGAIVAGTPQVDGWSAIYYAPVTRLSETERDRDLNGDGDRVDSFDLGQLRLRAWTPIAATTEVQDLPITPTAIVQAEDEWGVADLDGDGEADPMFLWHDRSSKLQVQLVFWVGHDGRDQQFTKVESSIRLERKRP